MHTLIALVAVQLVLTAIAVPAYFSLLAHVRGLDRSQRLSVRNTIANHAAIDRRLSRLEVRR